MARRKHVIMRCKFIHFRCMRRHVYHPFLRLIDWHVESSKENNVMDYIRHIAPSRSGCLLLTTVVFSFLSSVDCPLCKSTSLFVSALIPAQQNSCGLSFNLSASSWKMIDILKILTSFLSNM